MSDSECSNQHQYFFPVADQIREAKRRHEQYVVIAPYIGYVIQAFAQEKKKIIHDKNVLEKILK